MIIMSSISVKSRNFYYYFDVSCDKCEETIHVDDLTINNGSIYCPKCGLLL